MKKNTPDPLVSSLDDLLDDYSMPEIVAALVRMSRGYKIELKREKNREYQGWEVWELSLETALRNVEGDDEADDLLGAA